MSAEFKTIIQVYLLSGIDKHDVGRLALKNRQILFEYSNAFIKKGLS